MLNSTMSLQLAKLQKKDPKGKAVETDYASAYESLGKEIKAKYPLAGKAERQSYGSRGNAFGA